ncbi:hypothetical protein BpHYR1_017610 [Brachionus plicatilis]|uniref:Uncharacterized protein n=1 Tax=Brachionus plicatilis TaxID=10195 RepID=A0A3M7Q8C9_BRAPC|nr:hypothetical protein BpHYR1_017610 [Brachionus plicatilis]
MTIIYFNSNHKISKNLDFLKQELIWMWKSKVKENENGLILEKTIKILNLSGIYPIQACFTKYHFLSFIP